MARPQQLRLLRLNQGENRSATLYRLEKGWVLHFVLGPSLAGLDVRLFINHPIDPKQGPNRHVYHELQWQNYSGSKVDVYDNYAEVHIGLAGSFNYYFTLNGSDVMATANGHGYFLVDPVLRIGHYDTKLPLDSISCQTVLTKLLGPFPQWEDRLRVTKESGYNMVHFTPLQELGESNSCYCLKAQLKLNPDFSTMLRRYTFSDVGELVKKMRDEWEVLSLTDLVLNHTANESEWLQEHPESAYNVVNSPHLKPAYIVDRILCHLSLDIAAGRCEHLGLLPEITCESQLMNIKELLSTSIFPSYKLHEFYQVDIDATVLQYKVLLNAGEESTHTVELHHLEIIQDPLFRRLKSSIDFHVALKLYRKDGQNFTNLTRNLNDLNRQQKDLMDSHLGVATDNFISNIRWRFIDPKGPRFGTVSKNNPLMWNYFVLPQEGLSVSEEEELMMTEAGGQFCMAHNGWVINADPMKNFAEPGSDVYLKRELIPWGDSVKLRFGKKPEDNPYLWEHMRQYATETARIFHGVRLDNCHSTPIHVAEYMLDEARKVRPDLYVIAELFTNNCATDHIFINRLGLNSLIREAMSAWDAYELGRLVHLYGGRPVGSMLLPPSRLLQPSSAHAIFLDQTHDNESPIEKRTALDLLPTSALVAMTCCATGSNRGYDEFVPHHINVVTETRLYTSWSDASKNEGDKVTIQTGIIEGKKILNKLHQELSNAGFNQVSVVSDPKLFPVWPNISKAAASRLAVSRKALNQLHDKMMGTGFNQVREVAECYLCPGWSDLPATISSEVVSMKTGLIAGKRKLNQLHAELAKNGYAQVYVDKLNTDIVAVTRHNPISHQGVIMVVRTAFNRHPNNVGAISMSFPGLIEEVLMEAHVVQRTGSVQYSRDPRYLNGLPNHTLKMRENIKIDESKMVKLKATSTSETSDLDFANFNPGSIICFKVTLDGKQKSAILNVRQLLSQFGYRMRTYSGRNLQEIMSTDLERITTSLSLNDLNRVLYHVGCEESDDGFGFGAYNVPGYGDLPYCGLQGIISVLRKIRKSNDLGHPLCANLRTGDWLLDYVTNRLKVHAGTKQLGMWFETAFSNLRRAPRYLIPCYFDAIISGVYTIVEEVAWASMSDFVQQGSSFERSLAMGSIQFVSFVKTARLPELSPNLEPPRPKTEILNEGVPQEITLSLAAGLPHFASGIWRNWGRDTFISFRGLLLITGRYSDARFLILAFASTLRHGLIPNLLGGGTHARYNCRDAVWWWLQCIQEYCMMVEGGNKILTDTVSRIFPTDDSTPHPPGDKDQPLHNVMQEALQKHAVGLKFCERGAGPGIDRDMTDEGFSVQIGVNWKTGFVFGGNGHNCGTWMDKMGSSEAAGNKGIPATPRDGSAVELVGLCKSTVRWLHLMYEHGKYPYRGVEKLEDGNRVAVSFGDWDKLIQRNFEKYFWINTSPDPKTESAPGLINKRGIYKDVVGASQVWTDYQLRSNFPIALVVAPELVDPAHAWTALGQAEKYLLGPLGMKTLDPSDMQYCGSYNNSDETNGFNYHQGPEWVWPVGYFLRAKLHFAALDQNNPAHLSNTVLLVKRVLAHHNVQIHLSDWKSLPELTNENGIFCHDSCGAQAWSMGCILEVLYMLEHLSAFSTTL